jgi:hypothetical protein
MIASVVTTASVSYGWKWLAVLIGFAVLALLWAFLALTNRQTGWKIWKLVEGEDGVSSTSKFQWSVWLVVVLFAYTVLWVLRARSGNYSAITVIPANLMAVLGLSTGTAVAAKAIKTAQVKSRQVTGAQNAQGGILQDDSGVPALSKIQMIGFTFISVGIFLATLIHQIHSNPVQTGLPNIDSSLLALMGISQGGYLGTKLVPPTNAAPSAIPAPAPPAPAPAAPAP